MRAESEGIGPRVLVVEDDPIMRRVLRPSLAQASFQVTEAASGEEALNVLTSQALEAVVLDLRLPDGRGGAVLERLHQMEEQGNAPQVWVVISALDYQEATGIYGSLGPHLLSKPFNPWDLVRLLESLISARNQSQ